MPRSPIDSLRSPIHLSESLINFQNRRSTPRDRQSTSKIVDQLLTIAKPLPKSLINSSRSSIRSLNRRSTIKIANPLLQSYKYYSLTRKLYGYFCSYFSGWTIISVVTLTKSCSFYHSSRAYLRQREDYCQ